MLSCELSCEKVNVDHLRRKVKATVREAHVVPEWSPVFVDVTPAWQLTTITRDRKIDDRMGTITVLRTLQLAF
jgi:hypothetical protein